MKFIVDEPWPFQARSQQGRHTAENEKEESTGAEVEGLVMGGGEQTRDRREITARFTLDSRCQTAGANALLLKSY